MIIVLKTIFGICLLIIAIFKTYLLISSSSWNRVMGEVIKSATIHDHRRNLWPKISYKYEVNGKQYFGNRINAGGVCNIYGWNQGIHDLIDAYPVKSQIPVYYHPKWPILSCLKKEGLPSIIILGVSAFLFLWIGFN
jgi:hypothetical protein